FGRDVGTSIPLVLTGVTMSNPREEHILGQNPSVAFAVTERAGTSERTSHALHPSKDGEQTLASRTGAERILFAGSTNRHFAAFLWGADEDAEKDLQGVRVRTWPVQEPMGHHVLHSVPQAVYRFSLEVPPQGGRSARRFRLYLGPKTTEVFEERPEYERFDAIMDYDLRPLCFCSVPGVRLLARTLLWGMRGLHSIVGNWGLAIVLLTLIVRSLLVPLNFRMQKSMRAYGAKMSRLQPELEKLKKKYANDPKRMQQEMLAFQRKHKLFPPLGGCLPLLVTIPVFFGLFTALRVAYELRYQPFVAWIDDLSSPDRLFHLGLDLGFVHLEYFNLLPILMVVLW
ncbi:MAG: membrane protein insertase YidC, partial [Bacteroidetes bacterium]